jgi:hypothetical protein
MIKCRKFRSRMIEDLYGELGPADKARLDRHIGACAECAAELGSLRATLKLMDLRQRPDPGQEFWDGYWDRLSRRILWESIEEGRRPSLATRIIHSVDSLPRWSFQAAGAAALLFIGILVGSRLVAPPSGTGRGQAAAAVPAGAVIQAENFIERSKVLLLGLVNYDPATGDTYALDLDRKKTMSRDLAAEAPALRRALTDRDSKKLRGLVSDLEIIMMQIANLGAGQDVEGIELVKQGVNDRGIFLKIDLDRMGRDARGATPPGSSKGESGVPKKIKT